MKLLVVGIDGLDARLCKKWKKRLPGIGQFFEHGSIRSVKPTMPPITPISWTTVHTGMNPRSKRRPGGHGVLGFRKRKGVPFLLEDAGHKTIWELIGTDYRVGVIHMPMMIPVPPFFGGKINGFVIADRPLGHWVGRKEVQTKRTVWPEDLAEMAAQVACWPVDIDPAYSRKSNPAAKMKLGTALWKKVEQRRPEGVKMILEKYPVDVLAVGSSIVDRMCHVAHHLGQKGWHQRIRPAFETADRLIMELIVATRPDNVMLVSDHGVSPQPGGKLWGHSLHATVAGLGSRFGTGWVNKPKRSVACFAPTVMEVLGIPKDRWDHMQGRVATELFAE